MTTIEQSFGVIACADGITGKEILLVQQQDREGNPVHWSFPKGHAEEGEEHVVTALREFQEETGVTLSQDAFDKEAYFDYDYMFMGKEGFVEKKNRLFLVSIPFTTELAPQTPDVYRARFVNIHTARKLMTFSNVQPLFDKIEEWIATLE